MVNHYIVLDHTADLAIQVEGSTLNNLFENAGMALTTLLVEGASPSAEPTSTEITVSGQDLTDLLVRWLGEILYLLAGDDRVVTDIKLRHIGPERLEANVKSVPFDPCTHSIRTEVKGVTYHQAEVIEEPSGQWVARVILDV
jgi:SHS2 domain-containing protein